MFGLWSAHKFSPFAEKSRRGISMLVFRTEEAGCWWFMMGAKWQIDKVSATIAQRQHFDELAGFLRSVKRKRVNNPPASGKSKNPLSQRRGKNGCEAECTRAGALLGSTATGERKLANFSRRLYSFVLASDWSAFRSRGLVGPKRSHTPHLLAPDSVTEDVSRPWAKTLWFLPNSCQQTSNNRFDVGPVPKWRQLFCDHDNSPPAPAGIN